VARVWLPIRTRLLLLCSANSLALAEYPTVRARVFSALLTVSPGMEETMTLGLHRACTCATRWPLRAAQSRLPSPMVGGCARIQRLVSHAPLAATAAGAPASQDGHVPMVRPIAPG
jgi:hypothetical protein